MNTDQQTRNAERGARNWLLATCDLLELAVSDVDDHVEEVFGGNASESKQHSCDQPRKQREQGDKLEAARSRHVSDEAKDHYRMENSREHSQSRHHKESDLRHRDECSQCAVTRVGSYRIQGGRRGPHCLAVGRLPTSWRQHTELCGFVADRTRHNGPDVLRFKLDMGGTVGASAFENHKVVLSCGFKGAKPRIAAKLKTSPEGAA